MADKENNTMGDVKYKIYLRGMEELKMSHFTVAEDNPRGLTAAEITDWKRYRTEWAALMLSPPEGASTSTSAEMFLTGIDIPVMPDGWVVMTRAVGDLPPIICRITDLDAWDPSTTQVADIVTPVADHAGETGN